MSTVDAAAVSYNFMVIFFQIVTAVSVIQKLPEIAQATTTSPEVTTFYDHLTSKRYSAR